MDLSLVRARKGACVPSSRALAPGLRRLCIFGASMGPWDPRTARMCSCYRIRDSGIRQKWSFAPVLRFREPRDSGAPSGMFKSLKKAARRKAWAGPLGPSQDRKDPWRSSPGDLHGTQLHTLRRTYWDPWEPWPIEPTCSRMHEKESVIGQIRSGAPGESEVTPRSRTSNLRALGNARQTGTHSRCPLGGTPSEFFPVFRTTPEVPNRTWKTQQRDPESDKRHGRQHEPPRVRVGPAREACRIFCRFHFW